MNELAVYLQRLELERPDIIDRTLNALDEIRIEVTDECFRELRELLTDPPFYRADLPKQW